MDILLGNGYQLTEGNNWPTKKIPRELILNIEHNVSFFNKQLKLCVEVHWVLMHALPVSDIKMEEIIAGNIMEMSFAGRKFNVLTKEFELLFLLIHGSRHGWSRLKWLVDINDYPLREINLQQFNSLFLFSEL